MDIEMGREARDIGGYWNSLEKWWWWICCEMVEWTLRNRDSSLISEIEATDRMMVWMGVEGEEGVKDNSKIIPDWPTKRKMIPLSAV